MAALTLDSPISALSVTKKQEEAALARLGITTVRELLLAEPAETEATHHARHVGELRPGTRNFFTGLVESAGTKVVSRNRGRLYITEASIADGEGARVRAVWFRTRNVRIDVSRGRRVALTGEVRTDRYGGVEFPNPSYEEDTEESRARLRRRTVRYHLTQGLKPERYSAAVEEALPLAAQIEDPVPVEVLRRTALPALADAVVKMHRPSSADDFEVALRRLQFDRMLELNLAMLISRRERLSERSDPIPFRLDVMQSFMAGLPFQLTAAQRKCCWQIFQDMEAETPMARLLNGDVGAGKTVVAAAAAAMAHAAGKQTVIMAPTDILARQHHVRLREQLETTFPDLRVELLVSALPAAERRRVRMAAASGHCAVVVGTHALIEEDVELADLGLAIVDEQHRFGSRQRELLRQKGRTWPHFLAMTATPIPRSLHLALIGDLDVSYLDELPPGRQRVRTNVVLPAERARAYATVRKHVADGHQAFVICPLIEGGAGDEAATARAATVEYERLSRTVFPDLRVALVHGRMKDKDAVMKEFAAGASDILVATSVVEVGVDVPNATVIMIEAAERFGLAQLHQLRGRVGRGDAPAQCLLLVDIDAGADDAERAPAVAERLRLMTHIYDGFRLAEEDLERRGMGGIMGLDQHGKSSDYRPQDPLFKAARAEAQALLAADPDLERLPAIRAGVGRRLDVTLVS